jgi:two-component system, NarL family, response regulator LiaR
VFRKILLYAVCLAALIGLLKWMEYKFLVRSHAFEMYAGLIALVFVGLGIWAGIKITHRKTEEKIVVVEKEVLVSVSIEPDPEKIRALGLSDREMDVLKLVAQGHSNQEIAEKLFVSPNTIKTHTSNLFLKLEVNRRMQAVKKAKELGLI